MTKKKLFLFSFLLIIGGLGCSSDVELHRVTDENGFLVEEYQRRKKDYAKQGLYKAYYAGSENIMELAHYENDKMNGEFIRFYENGDTLTVALMKDGVYEGYFREYYKGNKLMQSYSHAQGKIKGLFKKYYPSGELKEEILFENNDENGAFTEYHINGNKAIVGTYKDGKEVGELLKYSEDGELVQKMDCKILEVNGVAASVCSTTWKKEE